MRTTCGQLRRNRFGAESVRELVDSSEKLKRHLGVKSLPATFEKQAERPHASPHLGKDMKKPSIQQKSCPIQQMKVLNLSL